MNRLTHGKHSSKRLDGHSLGPQVCRAISFPRFAAGGPYEVVHRAIEGSNEIVTGSSNGNGSGLHPTADSLDCVRVPVAIFLPMPIRIELKAVPSFLGRSAAERTLRVPLPSSSAISPAHRAPSFWWWVQSASKKVVTARQVSRSSWRIRRLKAALVLAIVCKVEPPVEGRV